MLGFLFASMLSISHAIHKGVCWGPGKSSFYNKLVDYNSTGSRASLNAAAKLGVDWVQIETTWFQHQVNSTEIGPWAGVTPTDDSFEAAIVYAKTLGMKVLLNAHIEISCNQVCV